MNAIILVAFVIGSFAGCTYATSMCGGCDIVKMEFDYEGDESEYKDLAKITKSDVKPEVSECVMTVDKKQCIKLLKPLTFQKAIIKCQKGLVPLNKEYTPDQWDEFRVSEEAQEVAGHTGVLDIVGKGVNEAKKYCPKADSISFKKYEDKMKMAKGTTKCDFTIIFEEGTFKGKSSMTVDCQ